jgi:hypothetical protein
MDEFMQSKAFTGSLEIPGHNLSVNFTAGIETSDEVTIVFDRFKRSESTRFIHDHWETGLFTLIGSAEDGTSFSSDDIIFTSLRNRIDENEATICPEASCCEARFIFKCESSRAHPQIKWFIKGFENFHPLIAETALGRVEMRGVAKLQEIEKISGDITISSAEPVADQESWRENASKLAEHVRYVMSFASNAMLRAPIIEFASGNMVEVTALSQGAAVKGDLPPFKSIDQAEIFKCAIQSHFAPGLEVEKLHYAIEWSVMKGSYSETNLISAMTVLENLIDSNLSEEDTLFLQPKRFDKLRKKLRSVVREEAKAWTEDAASQEKYVIDFNERFGDLNRRSLMEKINLLAQRWGVDLDGISIDSVQAAKRARDHIVHRGNYEPSAEGGDLYGHVLTTNELVVRFILTALQFEGEYYSFLGRYHRKKFTKNAPS